MPAALDAMLVSLSRRRLVSAGLATAGSTLAGIASAATASSAPAAVRWLNRASFGYSQADLAAFNALGGSDNARWNAWITQQLAPSGINDSACDARVANAGFTTLGKTAAQLWADHHSQENNYSLRMRPIAEAECMTLIRQIYSKRQLFEVLVDFWHDHFSVYGRDYSGGPMFPAFDRDAIRAHALGNFRTLLQASGESASMMFMLDQYASTRAGPNENYARELCELHTLGAQNYAGILAPDDASLPIGTEATPGGGSRSIRLKYVDADVYEATRILTGMTLSGSTWPYDPIGGVALGEYVFDDAEHDQYPKSFLNSYFPAYQHQQDVEKLYDILAAHPGTAAFVAGKLCRRLLGDTASASLIDSAASLFESQWEAPDQIAQVVGLILRSAEFMDGPGSKVKRPTVAAVSALRACAADFTPSPDDNSGWSPSEEFLWSLQAAGHRPFNWPAPNGYPDNDAAWSSSGTLGMCLRQLPRLLEMRQSYASAGEHFLADIQAQTLAAFPAAANRTAAQLVDYWC
ncbi:MAG TPA: DUF1800 domain-containing protein, partial [Rhodanobacteraceae bacterium]|nr:DUF1800 domain-containing protein [Rhodanobacteraceae bacterium]